MIDVKNESNNQKSNENNNLLKFLLILSKDTLYIDFFDTDFAKQ